MYWEVKLTPGNGTYFRIREAKLHPNTSWDDSGMISASSSGTWCVYVYVYTYIYIYTHTYIYIFVCVVIVSIVFLTCKNDHRWMTLMAHPMGTDHF